MSFVLGSPERSANGPKGSGVAVFGPLGIQPLPSMIHEIPETECSLVESVPQKGQVNARQAPAFLMSRPAGRILAKGGSR